MNKAPVYWCVIRLWHFNIKPLNLFLMRNDNTDITSISIELNELKSEFDRSMRQGDTFANLKKVYMKIKELTCHLQALQWDAQKFHHA
jgi:hypothetical protein